MAIFKNKDIEVNVNEKSVDVGFIDTNFYTEDKSTSSIRITIKNNKRAIDLSKTNLTPKLDLFHSDGSIFMDENINVILPEKGIIQYEISDQVIKHPGKVNAKLFLKNETQSVHVANFNFTIKDSGITEAVNKEVTVNIVDDSVRRIIQENAIELLGQDFEQRLNDDVVSHLESKPELFKGPKGVEGPRGIQGPKGDKGDRGERGYQGLKGEQGPKGETGSQGLQGMRGERGLEGPKGDRGKDSSQRNFSEMKIAVELPRYFNNYDSIKISSGNEYYYPQGLAVTQNYYFLTFQPTKKANGEGDNRRILVAYDKNGEEITKFLMGGFGGEGLHVEENNGQVIIYAPYGTSDIGKSTVSISSNNYANFSEIPDLVPSNIYKVNLLYQFSKISDGWIVELNTTSKGTYQQRDLFAVYNEDFTKIKKYIALASSNSTLWNSPLENKSVKRQGITVYKNELVQIVGGNTYNDDEETNYSNQGVQVLSPEGKIVRDYTYSIKEFNEFILSRNKETQRIEHEGAFVYNDEIYSCVVYNTNWSYTGKGLLIVKYGSYDEPDHIFSKGGSVSTAMDGERYALTPVGTSVANMYTGELIDNMEDIIKYMLATYQEKGYLYTSKVRIKDFGSSTVMPGGIFIDITNLNNRTFWVVYKSLTEKKEKHVTFEWSTNTFIYNTPSW
ncbi:BppU family phage baseplate upper protein [Mammaliicoccus sciuri]|uniref:BppU family phage baseplate upper protein n=1 Tax=Mammaliicoccus sciuri TaxID=1296 RepID=UPI002737C559|nr:BppU family phage baseplate upper protein [Mammaliicoccus sciuri]